MSTGIGTEEKEVLTKWSKGLEKNVLVYLVSEASDIDCLFGLCAFLHGRAGGMARKMGLVSHEHSLLLGAVPTGK